MSMLLKIRISFLSMFNVVNIVISIAMAFNKVINIKASELITLE